MKILSPQTRTTSTITVTAASCALSLAASCHAASLKVPMVEGDCGEYQTMPATSLRIAGGSQLYIADDDHYL
jgi:hypothetical protein